MRLEFRVAVLMFGIASGCSNSDDSKSSGSSLPKVAFGETRTGDGTYYDATGDGACSLGPSPNDMNVAALNAVDWGGSSLCGACAEVTGPLGTVTLRIVDLCPECKKGDLDLSPEAFEQIAELSAGRVSISWTLVTCDITSPVKYQYKDGSNEWWTAVQVRNHRLPVTHLEYSTDDGATYSPAERTDYNYFLAESGFGPKPVRVRITAIDGQSLEDELPAVEELLVVNGKAQFQ